jgi:hypothetical protein
VDPAGLHPPLGELKKKKVYRDTSVGIAAGLLLDGLDSVPVGDKIFFCSHSLDTQPPADAGSPYLQIKLPSSETHHSPPSSAEVKNGRAIFHSMICFHGVAHSSLSIATILPYFTVL